MKVAQVGYRLAQYLAYRAKNDRRVLPHDIDPDVVYGAGLAHDLGHPPFGHIGELALQDVLADKASGMPTLVDSFEGNAQSFRVVTRLSFRGDASGHSSGLNLTWGTLAAVLKYPWQHNDSSTFRDSKLKWGAYGAERSYLEGARLAIPDGWRRSVEASVMDWADDITYAVHDVEDFVRAGLIPIHELAASSEERRDFTAYCAPYLQEAGIDATDEDVRTSLRGFLRDSWERSYRGSRLDKQAMHAWASQRIDTFSEACSIGEDGLLAISTPARIENLLMQRLLWFYVVDHPSLSSEHHGRRRLIAELARLLYDWAGDFLIGSDERGHPHRSRLRRYPSRLVDFASLNLDAAHGQADGYASDEERMMRAVVDYLASLSDYDAVLLHQRLSSGSTESARVPRV